jgi:hypothetical protein
MFVMKKLEEGAAHQLLMTTACRNGMDTPTFTNSTTAVKVKVPSTT